MKTMTRKQFLGTLFGAAGVAALAACGGDDGGGAPIDAPGRNCATNGTSINIANNHGHTVMVSAADVTAGTAKSYDITGTGDQAHTVMVTAGNFTTLQGGGTLTLTFNQYLAHGSNATSADFLRVSIIHSGGTTQVLQRLGAARDG